MSALLGFVLLDTDEPGMPSGAPVEGPCSVQGSPCSITGWREIPNCGLQGIRLSLEPSTHLLGALIVQSGTVVGIVQCTPADVWGSVSQKMTS